MAGTVGDRSGQPPAPTFLRSPRLTVEIAAPGSSYAGSRFDWSSFITQVTLDGRHRFLAPEAQRPGVGTGGSGLCCEFDILGPAGFAETAVGETFPKWGVGLLTRPDERPYDFSRTYPIAPFARAITATATRLESITEAEPCRGLALRLERALEVADCDLLSDVTVVNTGTRAVHTREYCHNFAAIDGHAIGPDYRLELSQPLRIDQQDPWFRSTGSILHLHRPVPAGANAYVCGPLDPDPDGFTWRLVHAPSGVSVSEQVLSAPGPALCAVWATGHVICPEVFIDAVIAPGERRSWRRRYAFAVGLEA